MDEDEEGGRVGFFFMAWLLLRVLVGTALWMAIFLGTFVGYLTVPILLAGGFILAYAATDLIRQRFQR